MRLHYLEIKPGERHPMCFSLSATEAIIDRFGSLEAMLETMENVENAFSRISAIDFVLGALLDAGRRYCAEMGIDMPPPIRCRPADLIDVTDTASIRAIFETIEGDSTRTIEARGKNE